MTIHLHQANSSSRAPTTPSVRWADAGHWCHGCRSFASNKMAFLQWEGWCTCQNSWLTIWNLQNWNAFFRHLAFLCAYLDLYLLRLCLGQQIELLWMWRTFISWLAELEVPRFLIPGTDSWLLPLSGYSCTVFSPRWMHAVPLHFSMIYTWTQLHGIMMHNCQIPANILLQISANIIQPISFQLGTKITLELCFGWLLLHHFPRAKRVPLDWPGPAKVSSAAFRVAQLRKWCQGHLDLYVIETRENLGAWSQPSGNLLWLNLRFSRFTVCFQCIS